MPRPPKSARTVAHPCSSSRPSHAASCPVHHRPAWVDHDDRNPTLPLLHAMSRGTPEQARLIRKAIENGGHDNMSAVFAAIESTGGIPYTAQAAQQEADQAISAIESLPASPYKEALYSLAEFSVNRAY